VPVVNPLQFFFSFMWTLEQLKITKTFLY